MVGPRPRGAIQQHMDNSMMLRNAFNNRARPQMQPADMKMNGMIDEFRRASMMRQNGPSMEAAWRSSGPTASTLGPRPQMMMDPRVRMNAQHAMHMRQAMMYQQQMAMMSRPMMMPMNGGMVRPPPVVRSVRALRVGLWRSLKNV